MGVGGTLIGASMCNRKATGIDLNKNYINAYKEASKFLNLDEQETIVGDALKILKSKEFKKRHKKFSLVLIDPPYSNMMNKEKTGEDMKKHGKSKTPFTTSNYDLGNMNKKDFLNALRKSVEYSLKYLEESHYVVVFIKDMQPNGKELNLLHCDVINELNKISNLQYKGMKIWADQTAKLFPYGYPFSFVSTQIHQYILFFRKEKE
jgi:tRNA G10  N-methylase Trm11